GVPQDLSQALLWYRKASEQGHADSQSMLGRMYKNGEGVPQDYKEAYAWYSVLAANGSKRAEKNRDDMAEKLSPDDFSKAQKLATEYF
ncbi:tetratricopeptide repeat protein, partial [Shewanella sp.]|uniref:tetratricopeptide repeat protein n=1 Tax=Shewanella sp. TaxID=50422 RepID=UPI003F2E5D1A